MEKRMYVCQYCKKEYLPKKRKIQKFCSDSCRSSCHQQKKKSNQKLPTKIKPTNQERVKVDKMSAAGVGNALGGNLAAQALISIFTKEENKPATKGDLEKLFKLLDRFQEIGNMKNDFLGRKPYYDIVQKIVVYK